MGDYFIEFEVPPGGIIEVPRTALEEGFTGVARVRRCHLSTSSEESQATGGLLGFGPNEHALGPSLPAEFYPGVSFNDVAQLVSRHVAGQVRVDLPYAFITRAFRRFTWESREVYRVESRLHPEANVELALGHWPG